MQQDVELRVWERVSGAREQEPDLRGMELRCRESAAVLRILAEGCTGELRERLVRLQWQIHNEALTLRGMRILQGEEPERMRNYSAGKVGLRRGLAQCCHRCRQCREEYSACLHHGTFGPEFARMAMEETKRIEEILALIGMGT